jgi:hypothetical protein
MMYRHRIDGGCETLLSVSRHGSFAQSFDSAHDEDRYPTHNHTHQNNPQLFNRGCKERRLLRYGQERVMQRWQPVHEDPATHQKHSEGSEDT